MVLEHPYTMFNWFMVWVMLVLATATATATSPIEMTNQR